MPSIVDDRHRRLCYQKLTDSGELETQWASQLIPMSIIEVSGSQPLINHKLLKLSWLTSIITGLLLRGTILAAVVKSFVQYS